MALFKADVYPQRDIDHEAAMNRRDAGFTLMEMLFVILIFGFVMAGTSQMFVSTLTTHRQQSKIAETNIEGIIGLEMLRQDIGKAGFGLPWNGLTAYNEAAGDPYTLNDATTAPPRGIVSKNDVTGGQALPGTDYLVIKATNVATNAACSKWAFLSSGATGSTTSWTPTTENLSPSDRVIVLSPGTLTSAAARNLVTFNTQVSGVTAFADTSSDNETRLVYGVDPNTNLRMPFNRADYYVKIPPSGVPQRCAVGTGVLYHSTVSQSDGSMVDMPLLDCVADMQVIFRLDRNGDGNLTSTNVLTDLGGIELSAEQIRDQVKEARVYILAQEGQMDKNYTYTFPTIAPCAANQINVGSDSTVGSSLGRCFNLPGITNWQNCRWKIYTLIVKLQNLQ
jgi:prepilin-type N-terminal cleavage/methylation domain-containing protein